MIHRLNLLLLIVSAIFFGCAPTQINNKYKISGTDYEEAFFCANYSINNMKFNIKSYNEEKGIIKADNFISANKKTSIDFEIFQKGEDQLFVLNIAPIDGETKYTEIFLDKFDQCINNRKGFTKSVQDYDYSEKKENNDEIKTISQEKERIEFEQGKSRKTEQEKWSSGRNSLLKIQKKLASLGYDPGVADGILGKKTTAAIKKFQEDHGLPPDGTIDNSTLKELGF